MNPALACSFRRARSLPCQAADAHSFSLDAGQAVALHNEVAPSSLPKVPSLQSIFSPVFELELEASARRKNPSHGVQSIARRPTHLAHMAVMDMDRSASDLAFSNLQGQHRLLLESQLASSPGYLMLRLCKPANDFEHKLSQLVRSLQAGAKCGLLTTDTLAAELLAAGYLVQVREGTPASASGSSAKDARSSLRNLRHRFLVCVGYQDPSAAVGAGWSASAAGSSCDQLHLLEPIIIEPKFREQFLIANPTASYAALLQGVPPTFVGTLARLETVVRLVSEAMYTAFHQQGRTVPPWRSCQALLSKWCPAQIQELAKLMQRARTIASHTPAPANLAAPAPADATVQLSMSSQADNGTSCNHNLPRVQHTCALTQQQAGTAAAAQAPNTAALTHLSYASAARAELKQPQRSSQQAQTSQNPPAGAQQHQMQPLMRFDTVPAHLVPSPFAYRVADSTHASSAPLSPPSPAKLVQQALDPLTAPTLNIIRRSSSDLSRAASKVKKATGLLTAALKKTAVVSPAAKAATRKGDGEPTWGRITTVRWGAACADPSGS